MKIVCIIDKIRSLPEVCIETEERPDPVLLHLMLKKWTE